MSKLQKNADRFGRAILRKVTIHGGHDNTAPAMDEFDSISSGYLSDVINSGVEFHNLFRFADDIPLCEEFELMFEKVDRLIERALWEIRRRGDLSEGHVAFLVRLVEDQIPAAQLVDR